MTSQIHPADHTIFGHLIIFHQSSREIKEAPFMFKDLDSKTVDDKSEVSERKWERGTLVRSKSLNDAPVRKSATLLGEGCEENDYGVNSEEKITCNMGKVPLTDIYPTDSLVPSVSSSLTTYKRSCSYESALKEEASSTHRKRLLSCDSGSWCDYQKRRVSVLVDELLLDIYGTACDGEVVPRRRLSSAQESDYCSTSGTTTSWRAHGFQRGSSDPLHRARLLSQDMKELRLLRCSLRGHVQFVGSLLVRQLKRREYLRARHDKNCNVITALLQAFSAKRSQDTRMRFSVMPYPGDSGFSQWHDAMKMVARLPGGIPPEFRRRLWLTLAEKHLQARGVNWCHAERFCFNEWSNPDDDELGVQIVKDLHRTGCSLFCGAEAEHNQALLKRVLLAYARWNKAVGYCQGFNMLAALILQVMDRSEIDAVKVMIYLIEGVLPESYFANNLRGLSVDMAVFRDLLRLRLPALSRHLEQLQHDARDSATGTSYEPPLTNVFTMQWFLTLFSNCLPQSTVLRVWDLIFLEGNEVLLRTALAIWDGLADRILAVDSADEFYSIMGVLTREMLEFGLMDTNNLVKTIVTIAPFPFPELPELRDKYLYNITPWTQTVSTAAKRGLRLFYSDDDDETDEDDEKIAVATAYGISTVFRSPRRKDSVNRTPSPSTSLSALNYATLQPDRDRLALDISALKQQYAKLRERQRQAHIILTAACARQPLGPSAPTPVAMNHLLLGKSALLSVRGRRVGPPPGAVPPPANITLRVNPKPRQMHAPSQGQMIVPCNDILSTQNQTLKNKSGETLHWKDAAARRRPRRHSEDIIKDASTTSGKVSNGTADIPAVPQIIEPEGDVSEIEGLPDNEKSESDSSSTSTELCDEPDRLSDFDSEELTSISDASSYAADITRLSSLSAQPTPIMVVCERSPDNSSKSGNLKTSSERDISRSVSLDKSFGSVTEDQDIMAQNNCSVSITHFPKSVSSTTSSDSSDLVLSPTSTDTKVLSPADDESSLKSLNPSPTTEIIQRSHENYIDTHTQIIHNTASLSDMKYATAEATEKTIESTLETHKADIQCPESIVLNRMKNNVQHESTADETLGLMSSQGTEQNTFEAAYSNVSDEMKISDLLSSSVVEITNDSFQAAESDVQHTSAEDISDAPTSVKDSELQCDDGNEKEATKILTNDLETDNIEKGVLKEDTCVTLRDAEDNDPLPKVQNGLQEVVEQSTEERSTDDEMDMSILLEINHRLHCQEKGLQSSTEQLPTELEEPSGSDKSIMDYARMSELLVMDQKVNLGRRNSERALKIIQENSEILQRILQCQARRPSKLSEEESNGTNVASDDSNDANLSSVPTSSSSEKLDISTIIQETHTNDELSLKTVDSKTDYINPTDEYENDPVSFIPTWKQVSPILDLPHYNKSSITLTASPPEKIIHTMCHDKQSPYIDDDTQASSSSHNFASHPSGWGDTPSTPRKITADPDDDPIKCKHEDGSTFPNSFSTNIRPLVLSPDTHSDLSYNEKYIPGTGKTDFKLKDEPYPAFFDPKPHSHHNILDYPTCTPNTKQSPSFIHTSASKEVSNPEMKYGFTPEKAYCDAHFTLPKYHRSSESSSFTSEKKENGHKLVYASDKETVLWPETSDVCKSQERSDYSLKKTSDTSLLHSTKHECNKFEHSLELSTSKPSSASSSPLPQKSKSRLTDSFFFTESSGSSESLADATKYSHSGTEPDSHSINDDAFKKETLDCFQLDSSSFSTSTSASESLLWSNSPRHTHLPLSNKRRKEPEQHYRQRPSSSSPRRRTSEDFSFDLHPFLTSSLSDSRTDLTSTRSSRESHSSSPVISESLTETLNQATSGSLHGHSTKGKKEITSPPPSPFQRYTPPLRKTIARERPMSLHFDISPLDANRDLVNQSRTTSPLYKSFSMLSVNESTSSYESASQYENMNKTHSGRRCTDLSLTLPRTKGKLSRISSPSYSPTKSKEFYISLPPLKSSHHTSPLKSPLKFNPFPPRASTRQPKELGVKLGLYSITGDGAKGSTIEKST